MVLESGMAFGCIDLRVRQGAEGFRLRANRIRQGGDSRGETGPAAVARVASELHEVVPRQSAAAIANLEAQTLRYQTAFDKISQGVCFFDRDERLILCNRRYMEIYRLTADQVPPGCTLREITERRAAVGTCPIGADEYLAWRAIAISSRMPRDWTVALQDGRKIQVHHQPVPDGGWIATHEDVTGIQERRALAKERISLQTLIDPLPAAEFRAHYWEQKPLIVQRENPDYYGDLFTLEDFDAAITRAGNRSSPTFTRARESVRTGSESVGGIEEWPPFPRTTRE